MLFENLHQSLKLIFRGAFPSETWCVRSLMIEELKRDNQKDRELLESAEKDETDAPL